jgi:MarR family transcriptional regulator, 2-MHQ and catechol-resistance regulon repressor
VRDTGKQKNHAAQGVHLWLLLWKATKQLEALARRSVQETGLGLSDFGVLEALFHKGPLPMNALRKKVLLSSGSTTTAVDRLERSGLVKRSATSTDRRSRIVRLTSKGSDLISKLFQEHANDMEVAFSCLDDVERVTLANLLRKLGHQWKEPVSLKENPIATEQSGVEKC